MYQETLGQGEILDLGALGYTVRSGSEVVNLFFVSSGYAGDLPEGSVIVVKAGGTWRSDSAGYQVVKGEGAEVVLRVVAPATHPETSTQLPLAPDPYLILGNQPIVRQPPEAST